MWMLKPTPVTNINYHHMLTAKKQAQKTPALFHPTFKAYLAITVMIYP